MYSCLEGPSDEVRVATDAGQVCGRDQEHFLTVAENLAGTVEWNQALSKPHISSWNEGKILQTTHSDKA